MFLRTACVATALLVATSGRSGEPRSLGPDQCATCHAASHADWTTHGHAKAYERLPAKDRTNKLCLSCHGPDPERPEKGVHCETCHGAGSEYAQDHLMRDVYLRGYLGLKKVEAAQCAVCQQKYHSTRLKPLDLTQLWNSLHHRPTKATTPAPAPKPNPTP